MKMVQAATSGNPDWKASKPLQPKNGFEDVIHLRQDDVFQYWLVGHEGVRGR